MTTRTFPPEQLDFELARRQHFPPASLRLFPDQVREEWVPVNALRQELLTTAATDPQRGWREWELALAERQVERAPRKTLFYRIVDR